MHRTGYLVVQNFFNNHLDLLFSKFDSSLIEAILDLIMQGMKGTSFDVQADCCTCINHFNEYVLEKLQS